MRVLYIEDDALLRRATSRYLGRVEHFRTTVAEDGQEALGLLQEQDFDVVVSDIEMPHLNGIELHAMTQRLKPSLTSRFIFLSGGADGDLMGRLACLPNTFLSKPCSMLELRQAIEAVHAAG